MKVKISEIQSDNQKVVLSYLLQGLPLTQIDAWNDLKVWHIGEVIRQLRRKYGRELITTNELKNQRTGKMYGVYTINLKYMKQTNLTFVE